MHCPANRPCCSGLVTLFFPWAATRTLRRGIPSSVAGNLERHRGAGLRTTVAGRGLHTQPQNPPGEGLTQQSEQGSEVTPSRWAREQPEQHSFGVNRLHYWPRQSGHPGQRLTQLGQQLLQ
jgi:hypothetical protein